MAEAKTRKTEVSVESFLDKVADERQRQDAYTLLELMKDITGEPPKMWGPSIVGFGEYHYVYATGHEGDCCRVGFSPRKGNLTLYILPSFDGHEALLKKLGKFKTGKCCLYIKRLEDVDLPTLRKLIQIGFAHTESMSTPRAETAPTKKSRKKK